MLTVRELNEKYNNELAEILSVDEKTASVGYWIKSNEWGKGFCSQAFKEILLIVKKVGYTHVTASILKRNIASKRIWENYNAIFLEDTERYYPIIDLSQLNK